MEDPSESSISLFVSALGVTRATATTLVSAGFTSLEEIAYVPLSELHETGLDPVVLASLRSRARDILFRS